MFYRIMHWQRNQLVARTAFAIVAATTIAAAVLPACKSQCPPGTVSEGGLCHRKAADAAVDDTGSSALGGAGGAVADSGTGKKSEAQSVSPVAGSDGSTKTSSNAAGTTATGGRDTTNASAGDAGGSAGSAEESGGAGSSGSRAPAQPACGDGHIDSGETCDGNCPTKDSCMSTNKCLIASITGASSTCDAKCDLTPVTQCKGGDGCCAPSCNYGNDTDCSQSCGDGVVSGMETCEPTSQSKPCPTSCDDGDACTKDTLTGTPDQCNVECTHQPITRPLSGDGCCPSGANAATDNDCPTKCGDGVVTGNETCDPRSVTPCPSASTCRDDGCTAMTFSGDAASCTAKCEMHDLPDGAACGTGGKVCTKHECSTCGNGSVDPGEGCDSPPDSTATCNHCQLTDAAYASCTYGSSTGTKCPANVSDADWLCAPYGACARYCSTDSECMTTSGKGRCMPFKDAGGNGVNRNGCAISCTLPSDCPNGLTCTDFCAGTQYEIHVCGLLDKVEGAQCPQ